MKWSHYSIELQFQWPPSIPFPHHLLSLLLSIVITTSLLFTTTMAIEKNRPPTMNISNNCRKDVVADGGVAALTATAQAPPHAPAAAMLPMPFPFICFVLLLLLH